jgi:hypothetical protein
MGFKTAKKLAASMAIRKNIHNMPQGLSNPGFMPGKVQKGDFLKKPSRKYILFCFVLS